MMSRRMILASRLGGVGKAAALAGAAVDPGQRSARTWCCATRPGAASPVAAWLLPRDWILPGGSGAALSWWRAALCPTLACPDVEVASDGEYEQPVEGVQAAVDRVVVPEPGEQALHKRGQQGQHCG